MANSYARIIGVLGGFDLLWPADLASLLALFGTLDFDVDVTEPGCVVLWTWGHDMVLQLSLPLLVGLINLLEYAISSVVRPTQDVVIAQHRRANVIAKYLAFVNCLYMTLVRYTVGAFVCIDLTADGLNPAMKTDPNIECYSPTHYGYMSVAAVGLLLYTIGCARPIFRPTRHKGRDCAASRSLRPWRSQ